MLLAGGLVQRGYQCGMIWGAALAAGAQAYRRYGPGPQAETQAVIAAHGLVESFRASSKHVNCLDITGIQFKLSAKRRLFMQIAKFFIKGGPIFCFGLAARYARVAISEINSAYSIEHQTLTPPASCAAVLAQKVGATAMHTVMASGLAGGIGLSGGACGALGAAVWLAGLNDLQQGARDIGYDHPGALQALDRFVHSSGGKFNCCEIVGRMFKDPGDHAAFLRHGGCAELIQRLAAV